MEEMYYIFECDMWRGYRISIPGNWAILARARTSIASISGLVRDLLISSLAWISVQGGAYRGAVIPFHRLIIHSISLTHSSCLWVFECIPLHISRIWWSLIPDVRSRRYHHLPHGVSPLNHSHGNSNSSLLPVPRNLSKMIYLGMMRDILRRP